MPYCARMKTFNTAGPSIPGDHYMLDPLARIDLAIYPELWAGTVGQPWSVNALGHELT